LIAAAYFSKHCSAFQPITSPKALLDSLHFEDNHIKHTALISEIRKKSCEKEFNLRLQFTVCTCLKISISIPDKFKLIV
jgi:hypothetical protein